MTAMNRTDLVRQMAAYNQWMNDKLLLAAARLDPAVLAADRQAFFGSILRTLNHLVIADTIWLQRFARHPATHAALDPVRALPAPDFADLERFTDLPALAAHRRWLDALIVGWAESVAEPDLDVALHYANSRGVVSDKNFFGLLAHFFNHQTHHRGQVTTLLSQAGVDVGVTDLLALLPEQGQGQG